MASMNTYKSDFLHDLELRGFIKQATHDEPLDSYCSGDTPTAYIGFDATADSLHVGSLTGIMMLRKLQQAGGKPIVLVGGGTTKVGDPTDREKSRPMLTEEEINSNINGIRQAFEPFLKFGNGSSDAITVNNNDWLKDIGYVDFLREIGRHFTINTMVRQDTVARRLKAEQPYTFLEFNYVMLQSYDFLELYRRHSCRLQMGGSDQWGNIVSGTELIHKVEQKQAFGLTSPLVTTASGNKMGKTADGAVWLNREKCSPYAYWQFWRNTEDGDVGRFLRLFTEIPMDEINRLEQLQGSEINDAKIALADSATAMLHGVDEATKANQAAVRVFSEKSTADSMPTATVSAQEINSGLLVAKGFSLTGLTKTNGEARRLIKQQAAKINDVLISDAAAKFSQSDIVGRQIKLTAGKKRHALLKIEG